jgi:hypothetical protein
MRNRRNESISRCVPTRIPLSYLFFFPFEDFVVFALVAGFFFTDTFAFGFDFPFTAGFTFAIGFVPFGDFAIVTFFLAGTFALEGAAFLLAALSGFFSSSTNFSTVHATLTERASSPGFTSTMTYPFAAACRYRNVSVPFRRLGAYFCAPSLLI